MRQKTEIFGKLSLRLETFCLLSRKIGLKMTLYSHVLVLVKLRLYITNVMLGSRGGLALKFYEFSEVTINPTRAYL